MVILKQKQMAKERDLKYKAFSMKLAEETKEWLMEEQKKSGISWNLFIVNLLVTNKNDKETKRNH